MKIVLTGGGTAGHINPALALGDVLVAEGHEVLYAGTPQGIEKRLAEQANIPFYPFEGAGFNRERPWTLLTSTFKLWRSAGRAKAWMRQVKPDCVVGFGGYVSIPVGYAATQLGVPLVVHEQNSVMGMANKFLGKRADAVALTYEVAGKDIEDKSKLVVCGNPVRAKLLTATREQGREMLGVPNDATMLLVFGGSLGAKHLNDVVCSMKDELLAVDGLYVVHVAGPKQYDEVKERLALTPEEEERWKLFSYQDRMPETLAAADCVLSRAGATSLAEIAALAVPALLVPFPFAAEDHQTMNARSYVDSGAAAMIADADIDGQEFKDQLMALATDAGLRDRMKQAAKGLKAQDAAAALAQVVYNAARKENAN